MLLVDQSIGCLHLQTIFCVNAGMYKIFTFVQDFLLVVIK